MRPTLTSDVLGETYLTTGQLSVHGQSAAEQYVMESIYIYLYAYNKLLY